MVDIVGRAHGMHCQAVVSGAGTFLLVACCMALAVVGETFAGVLGTTESAVERARNFSDRLFGLRISVEPGPCVLARGRVRHARVSSRRIEGIPEGGPHRVLAAQLLRQHAVLDGDALSVG